MKMTLGDCYRLARSERLSHEQAIIAAGVAMAESGCDSDAVGDQTLTDSTWGPSIGLWQIRSLRAQDHTAGVRDAFQLKSPVFNAHSMASISSGGTSWGAWSTYKNGAYKQHLAAARAAAGKGAPLHAPTPSGQGHTVPASQGSNGWDLDPLPGGSGVPGYGDDLLGWVTGKAKDELFGTVVTGIIYASAFGLAVTLVAIGGWRIVSSGASP